VTGISRTMLEKSLRFLRQRRRDPLSFLATALRCICGPLIVSWVLACGLPCSATIVQIMANAGGYGGGCVSRCVVRTTNGDIYAVLLDNSATPPRYIRVFESTDGGATWTQQDAADAPWGDNYHAQSAAIDGNGIIHIAYWDSTSSSTGLRYVTFSTTTNTFSGTRRLSQ